MRAILSILAIALLSACAVTPHVPVAANRPMAPLYRGSFGAASCVAGTTGIAPAATLTFTAPTTNIDGTPIVNLPLTYDLYEGTLATSLAKSVSGITGSPDVIKQGLQGNTTYYFAISAVDSKGEESAQSNAVCKTFPVAPPNTVVVTIE